LRFDCAEMKRLLQLNHKLSSSEGLLRPYRPLDPRRDFSPE
jgi:hypothetical protein